MSNLIEDNKQRDFWVWIDPSNWLVRHSIEVLGKFSSNPQFEENESNLMFIPNPKFKGSISPFQHGMINYYLADYNLEINREYDFKNYPSRLNSIFLLPSEDEAYKYKERHINHVGNRILKKVKTIGSYQYSYHDSSWIDFMRLSHSMDDKSIRKITHSYWKGINVTDCELKSKGSNWNQKPIIEVLYLGQIEFYERKIS
ncbi:MAG: hypothetical protein ACI81I_000584 [Arcobacteraceae bacterium]|jgi:hypothetical protein